MSTQFPGSAEELARTLGDAVSRGQTITLFGNGSKNALGGPVLPGDVQISSARLSRVLHYEPNDLTLSVESGCSFAQLQKLLATNGQMIALDPPFAAEASIGGSSSSDGNAPMRQAFATARDQVIGMTFAVSDGSLVSSGGTVVKNVAGLDMAKLLIGSWGTLGAITSINLRLHPRPQGTLTFLRCWADADPALIERDQILHSPLRPLAFDLLSPAAATRLNRRGWLLAVRAAGSPRVLERYRGELSRWELLEGTADRSFWRSIREWTPDFIRRHPSGAVVRLQTPLSETAALLRLISGACVVRAGSGVAAVYVTAAQSASVVMRAAAEHGWSCVLEFIPDHARQTDQRPAFLTAFERDAFERNTFERQNAFAIMETVKHLFDRGALLNKARLYGRF